VSQISANVERWSAWAPGIESQDQWLHWARGELSVSEVGTPDVLFLPAMLRRRLSRHSKIALKVAHDCIHDSRAVETVFCSRHGELVRTSELLNSLAKEELLSPTAFSMSVHNTAAGLFSIVTGNPYATIAVAACEDTLELGFIEACSTIKTGRAERVLLVIADEVIPAPFCSVLTESEKTFGMAFMLTSQQLGNKVCLTLMQKKPETKLGNEQHALVFLRFLLSDEKQVVIPSHRLQWMWTKND